MQPRVKNPRIAAETIIRKFVGSNHRSPTKRELSKLYRPTRLLFGTWNNAVSAAGFTPNPILFAKHHISKDGHLCDSLSEKIIDDWLSSRKITHKIHVPYDGTKYTADFLVKDVLIEFFGLTGQVKRYDQLMQKKLHIIKSKKLKFISIYPKDIFPKPRLDELLNSLKV